MNDQAAINSGKMNDFNWKHFSDNYNYRGKVNVPNYTADMTDVKVLHWSGYMHEAHERFPKPWDDDPIQCHAQTLWEKYRDEMNEQLR